MALIYLRRHRKLRVRGLIHYLRSFKDVASTAQEVDEEEENEKGTEVNDVNEESQTCKECQYLDLCTTHEYNSNDANDDMTDYTTESTSSSTVYPSSSDGRSTLNSATESVDNLNDSDSDDNNGRMHPKIPFDSEAEMRFSNSNAAAKKILIASSSEVFYECLGSPVIRPYQMTPTTKLVTPPSRSSKQLIVKDYEDSIKVRTCYRSGTDTEAASCIQINESVQDIYDSYHNIVTPNKPYTEPIIFS
ncbi:hypothetical protein CHS0354_032754 [Potamilus streckersoni]|uniref:Uncharacterized protein n=1 Tax=Potamilus streckersoni TaxID=2493646 RepID=A0AAE0WDM9_9BIVA|nr:hypothetical protein CHS0354_032754 [Potamilus streckersoni]